jgi:hypothetical protein
MAPHAPASITAANHREEQMMIRVFLKPITIGIAILLYTAAAPITNTQTSKKTTATADLKLRQRMTSGGNENGVETVMYIKGPRMRSEMGVSTTGMTTIQQCDLKRTIMINDKARTYLIINDGEKPAWGAGGEGDGGAVPKLPSGQPLKETRRGGVVNVTNKTIDTGERKEMFGFTARHIKTSMVKEGTPQACDQDHKSETDGWYIDFQYDFACPSQKKIDPGSPIKVQRDCEDEVHTRTIGTAKLGFPVLTITTLYQPDGRTTSMTNEVLELSRAPLDAALFDVPAGYALAKSIQELYGLGTAGSTAGDRSDGPNVITSAPVNPSATGTKDVPKRQGTVRIGIVTPKTQMSAGDAVRAADAVRNTFASYLSGPNLEVVTLSARLPSQVLEEARQSECDFVLYTSVTQKKGGGGGMFGRALGNMAGVAAAHIPVNTSGEAAARSVAVTGIHTTTDIASSIKARDELSLEYKLEATDGGKPELTNTARAKAKADGDDVLTPLIEKAAEAVVAVVIKK